VRKPKQQRQPRIVLGVDDDGWDDDGDEDEGYENDTPSSLAARIPRAPPTSAAPLGRGVLLLLFFCRAMIAWPVPAFNALCLHVAQLDRLSTPNPFQNDSAPPARPVSGLFRAARRHAHGPRVSRRHQQQRWQHQ
jgi:hypothetical protein